MFLFLNSVYSQNPTWVNYNTTNSGISSKYINALTADGEGNLWVGTQNGVNKFDGIDWMQFSPFSLSESSCRALETDKNGNIYIGTYDGLVIFDGMHWREWSYGAFPPFYDSKFDFPSRITSLSIEQNGTIWIGSQYELVKYNGLYWRRYYYPSPDELPDRYIHSVCADKNGTIWIGTSKGLTRFNGENWLTHNTSNSKIPVNKINVIEIEGDSIIWIGTEGGGLVKFDGVNWLIHNTNNSDISSNNITAIKIDENGIKWIGTRSGLTKINGSDWYTFDTFNSGLPENNINALTIDNNGTIWIGTYNGLAAYNEKGITSTFKKEITICNNELPYIWHEKTFFNEGQYTNTIVNSLGLEIEVTLTLSVLPDACTELEISCPPDISTFDCYSISKPFFKMEDFINGGGNINKNPNEIVEFKFEGYQAYYENFEQTSIPVYSIQNIQGIKQNCQQEIFVENFLSGIECPPDLTVDGMENVPPPYENISEFWLDGGSEVMGCFPVTEIILRGEIIDTTSNSIIIERFYEGGWSYCSQKIYVEIPTSNENLSKISELDFQIFPNPNFGKFNLEVSNPSSSKIQIQIINDLGQIQFKKIEHPVGLTFPMNFDLSHLPKGNYYVKILDFEKEIAKKLVIQ